jgi:hypothetical protein
MHAHDPAKFARYGRIAESRVYGGLARKYISIGMVADSSLNLPDWHKSTSTAVVRELNYVGAKITREEANDMAGAARWVVSGMYASDSRRFAEYYEEVYGEEISVEEAVAMTYQLFALYSPLLRPGPSELSQRPPLPPPQARSAVKEP